MNRDALRWIGVLLALVLVAPVLLYLMTGSVLGLLLPCGSDSPLALFVYGGSTLAASCPAVGTGVRLVVAVWGTTLAGAATLLFGLADLLSSRDRRR